MQLINHRK